jgi:hypothetical protein
VFGKITVAAALKETLIKSICRAKQVSRLREIARKDGQSRYARNDKLGLNQSFLKRLRYPKSNATSIIFQAGDSLRVGAQRVDDSLSR